MKIQDTTGRSMLVDLVYNHPRMGWLKASTARLHTTVGASSVRGTIHSRLPHGRFGIRICSVKPVDAILFDNGVKIAQTSVPGSTSPQIIEFDDARNALEFRPAGDTSPREKATDVAVQPVEAQEQQLALVTADGGIEPADSNDGATYVGPHAPEGEGLVYVVLRFSKTDDPYGEPPQEEFELAFQMRSPEDFDEFIAQNLHLVEQAEALPNPRDPLSFEPAAEPHTHTHCTFSGCKH
jgi:hypothetical protein